MMYQLIASEERNSTTVGKIKKNTAQTKQQKKKQKKQEKYERQQLKKERQQLKQAQEKNQEQERIETRRIKEAKERKTQENHELKQILQREENAILRKLSAEARAKAEVKAEAETRAKADVEAKIALGIDFLNNFNKLEVYPPIKLIGGAIRGDVRNKPINDLDFECLDLNLEKIKIIKEISKSLDPEIELEDEYDLSINSTFTLVVKGIECDFSQTKVMEDTRKFNGLTYLGDNLAKSSLNPDILGLSNLCEILFDISKDTVFNIDCNYSININRLDEIAITPINYSITKNGFLDRDIGTPRSLNEYLLNGLKDNDIFLYGINPLSKELLNKTLIIKQFESQLNCFNNFLKMGKIVESFNGNDPFNLIIPNFLITYFKETNNKFYEFGDDPSNEEIIIFIYNLIQLSIIIYNKCLNKKNIHTILINIIREEFIYIRYKPKTDGGSAAGKYQVELVNNIVKIDKKELEIIKFISDKIKIKTY